MATRLKAGSQERQRHLLRAIAILREGITDIERLKRRIATSRTSWLVAEPIEGLDSRHKASSIPTDFIVMATDGSQIDVDRHLSTQCYLINIGGAILTYGSNPDAVLNNFPNLYSDEKDLVMTTPDGKGYVASIEGALLGIKRSIEELKQLALMSTDISTRFSTLALIDGSLILWGLMSRDYPEFIREELIDNGFIYYLNEIRKLNKDRTIAIASYISFPRSTEVVNTLKIAICPNEIPDCDRYCSKIASNKRECDVIAGIRDRELFFNLLTEGERSSLFLSKSSIVEKYYGIHRTHFFYLRVYDEIARIEVPQWVVKDENLLNLTHCLVLDQCRRGHGYPVALSEAHEQAVVTGADLENFKRLLEITLAEEQIPITTSAKSYSKKTKWI
jgi:hypothetical protein